MHTEAQHLNHLIDDLKVLSLADAGELPLTLQLIAPDELVRRTAAAHQVQASNKEIVLRVDAASNLPLIDVDVERMAQVLGNLVSNSLRYTPAGGEIVLSAHQKDSRVLIQVSDNGAGIAAEDIPFIFERSFRSDKARSQYGGETGLGLAIAKSLVELHGGSLSVQSELNHGATFTISLLAPTHQ